MKTALVALAAIALPVAARGQDAGFARSHYTKREVLIPMRDGVRLHTAIYQPPDTTRPHPIVMRRTPYSAAPYGPDVLPATVDAQTLAYLGYGFVIVVQDVRGRYLSEGEFVDVRPVITARRSSRDVDEATDTYDTVEWLVRNVPRNNGRVGVRGTSYPGFYASMAAISAHPAITVVSPQAPVTEWMGGDDFMHNGALLLPHSFDFFSGFGRARPRPTTESSRGIVHGTPDGYEFFLQRLGALSNVNPRFFHDSIAFWNEITRHPTWDAWWAARSARPHLANLRPAMLWVGGWFDTENLWGALHAYEAGERQSPGAVNRLVMGPWSHGQWNRGSGDSLGAVAWGSATGRFFTDSIEVPFFRYYLTGEGPAPRDYEAAVFETGANVWRFLGAWPPRNTTATSLYLREDNGLAFEPAAARDRGFDEYVSDPSRPVPYTAAITHWYEAGFMVEDQRFASRRPDVLVYQTPPLAADLTVAGPITVDFVVSTSGTDCDWVVKLVDVFPDDYGTTALPAGRQRRATTQGGYQMLVRGDVLRGKFRSSLSTPEPFVPDSATSLRFTLNDAFHTFRAGHRVMVQVQSTWFPMIDRNPGRFLDIFRAGDADFQRTTQRVYRSPGRASRLVVPVMR